MQTTNPIRNAVGISGYIRHQQWINSRCECQEGEGRVCCLSGCTGSSKKEELSALWCQWDNLPLSFVLGSPHTPIVQQRRRPAWLGNAETLGGWDLTQPQSTEWRKASQLSASSPVCSGLGRHSLSVLHRRSLSTTLLHSLACLHIYHQNKMLRILQQSADQSKGRNVILEDQSQPIANASPCRSSLMNRGSARECTIAHYHSSALSIHLPITHYSLPSARVKPGKWLLNVFIY